MQRNTTSDRIEIRDAEVQHALTVLLLDSLPLITAALCVLYLVFAVSHAFVLPVFARAMSIIAALTALLLAVWSLLLRRRRSLRWVHPTAALIVAVALVNSLLHMYLLADPQQTTNVMLLVIGIGFLFLSPVWLGAALAATLAGWAAVAALMRMPAAALQHFSFALLTSTVLAVLIHTVWMRVLRRLEGMRLREEYRKAELAEALAQSEASRSALELSKRELEDMINAVQQSEERFLRFTDLEGIAIHDHGTVLDANSVLPRMFGYTLPAILGRSVLDLITPAYRAQVREHLLSNSETRCEAVGLGADGATLPVEVSGKAVPYRGRTVGMIILRDITERKQAELALRESEARFRQLADAMPQIVWSARPDGRLEYVNRRGQELLGVDGGAATRTAWGAVLHPDDRTPTAERWYQAVQAGQLFQMQYRLRDHATQHYRWYLARAVPIRDKAANITSWFGTSTDIDDQKRAEEALENANRQKDEFLAMLAHELRNPLAPIRNSAQVLRLVGRAEPRVEQARAMIERQVTHLTRLVDDLLDVSRISRGKILLRKERVNLVHLVHAAVQDYRSDFERGSLRLTLLAPDHPVDVSGDPTRLAQVIGNLLHNAAKFTDPGGDIFVSLRVDAASNTAMISVRDTGIGMEPELLDRFFEPFTQADRSLARSRGGMGLGLALVRGLIDLHAGHVRAFSEGVGKGAEFQIHLPLDSGAPPHADTAPVIQTTHKSRRVLVIEDNADAAASMQLLLELSGHVVAVAHAGAPGVEMAHQFRPDVVLCDIGLPGSLDGYAVASALRHDPMLSAMFLIALTGYGQEEDRRRAREAGFDVHLTKPVDPTHLDQVLANLPENGCG